VVFVSHTHCITSILSQKQFTIMANEQFQTPYEHHQEEETPKGPEFSSGFRWMMKTLETDEEEMTKSYFWEKWNEGDGSCFRLFLPHIALGMGGTVFIKRVSIMIPRIFGRYLQSFSYERRENCLISCIIKTVVIPFLVLKELIHSVLAAVAGILWSVVTSVCWVFTFGAYGTRWLFENAGKCFGNTRNCINRSL
jgi:hypothetical protein